MKEKKVNILKEKGITLVALVVTIIILLILAGVTLNLALGESGIFSRAKTAADKYQKAEDDESEKILSIEDMMTEIESGITVEQVTDTKPGELEKKDDNTFIISSIEDLIFFAYDVANGNNYQGKIVELGQSLDFNSNKSYVNQNRTDYTNYGYNGNLKELLTTGEGFKPIGKIDDDANKDKLFVGTFNGNGNAIYNLYISINNEDAEQKKFIGLFSANWGTISNLKLLNANLTLSGKRGNASGIAGNNFGKIEKCIVSGKIKGLTDKGFTGGIAGFCKNATITECGNLAEIEYEKNNDEESVCAGGIAALLDIGDENSTINKCFNYGNIKCMNKGDGSLLIGGIVGSSNAKVSNCYNVGNVYGDSKGHLCLGGIIGDQFYETSLVANCYSVGQLLKGEHPSSTYIGMITGFVNTNTNKENCHYCENAEYKGNGNVSSETGITKETKEFMKTDEFINLLNKDNEGVWKKDTGINEGYPILSWQ